MRWSALLLVACGSSKTEPSPTSPAPSPASPPVTAAVAAPQPQRSPTGPVNCTEVAFAESTSVPEASGAAWMPIDGKLALVVISDSGNHGEYGIVDPETGATRETGRLPLGAKHDDLEGVAVRDGMLYGVTSPGFVLVWERVEKGFNLIDGPYALGPIDLPDREGGFGATPPDGDGMVCPERRTNCGRNYEGLCLAPKPNGRCIGFVAAKADGHLYCVVDRDGKLAVDRTGAIKVANPGAMADCAFAEDGSLYAGSNSFDGARVYRVAGWEAPARAKVELLAELSAGFPETLAVRGEHFYRMSDAGDPPSTMKKYRCVAK